MAKIQLVAISPPIGWAGQNGVPLKFNPKMSEAGITGRFFKR